MKRFGITVPFANNPIRELHHTVEPLVDAGVTDLWSSETAEYDAFGPLVAATQHLAPQRVGTAIAGIHLRGAGLLAMETAALLSSSAEQTRVALGLGVGSEVIVKRWNGLPFERHLERLEATIEFLRSALAGEKASSEILGIKGFQLACGDVSARLDIMVAALRPKMLRLAAAHGSGAITNWLTAADMPTVRAVLDDAGAAPDFDLVVRVPVFITDDPEEHFEKVKRSITTYLNVPTYAAFQRWLGHGGAFDAMWDAWDSGDRKASLREVPEDLARRLLIVGDESTVADGLEAFHAGGATTVVPAILPWGDLSDQVDRLASIMTKTSAVSA